MATDTSGSALRDPETLSEPRKIEARLFMAIVLALAGGLLWALFMVGEGIQRGVGTIQHAHAAGASPTSCGPDDLQTNAEGVVASLGSRPSVVTGQARAELSPATAAAVWTPEAAEPRFQNTLPVAKKAARAPTYVRAAPDAEPIPLELEALRPSL